MHRCHLTHWGRVTHICISQLTIIGSDNGLSTGWRQAIIWTNAGILLIGPLGTNFSEILIAIQSFSFKKTRLKMLSVKWQPFCLGLNVLNVSSLVQGIVCQSTQLLRCTVLWSTCHNKLGAVSIRKTVLPGMAIPMLKIRRPNGRLIFNIGIAIPR